MRLSAQGVLEALCEKLGGVRKRCYGRGAYKVASFSYHIYFQHRTRRDQRDRKLKQPTYLYRS